MQLLLFSVVCHSWVCRAGIGKCWKQVKMGQYFAQTTLQCQLFRSLVVHGGSDAMSVEVSLLIPMPSHRERDRSWQFVCRTSQDNGTQYMDGDWEENHSVLREKLFLKCPHNKFISGVYSNYSEQFLDRIWWIHCSAIDQTQFLTNCSYVRRNNTEKAISYSLPSPLAVFRTMYSTYSFATRWHNFQFCSLLLHISMNSFFLHSTRNWFFEMCILQGEFVDPKFRTQNSLSKFSIPFNHL